MIIGGAVAQKEGMKTLYFLVGIILIPMAFYGGRIGVIVSIIGEAILISYWFISSWNKPQGSLYISGSKEKPKSKSQAHDDVAESIRKSFQENLRSKYPAN